MGLEVLLPLNQPTIRHSTAGIPVIIGQLVGQGIHSIEKLKAAMGHSNIMVSLTYLRGLDVAELKEEDMPMI